MEQGSVVYRLGDWNNRGRVLATFELSDGELTEWQLNAALTAGAYAVVKWDHSAEPAVVPAGQLQQVTED